MPMNLTLSYSMLCVQIYKTCITPMGQYITKFRAAENPMFFNETQPTLFFFLAYLGFLLILTGFYLFIFFFWGELEIS